MYLLIFLGNRSSNSEGSTGRLQQRNFGNPLWTEGENEQNATADCSTAEGCAEHQRHVDNIQWIRYEVSLSWFDPQSLSLIRSRTGRESIWAAAYGGNFVIVLFFLCFIVLFHFICLMMIWSNDIIRVEN